MASKTFTVELKEAGSAKAMVAAVKAAAKAKDIDFTGDEKKGEGKKAGAKITYVVSGVKVTVTVEDSWQSRLADWDADRLAAEVKKWMQPYLK